MSTLFKRRDLKASAFSDFIRNASSAEKKKVYRGVLEGVSKRQEKILKRSQ